MQERIEFSAKLNLGWLRGDISGRIVREKGPGVPGPIKIIQVLREKDMLIYDVVLPVKAANDVVKRELTIKREGQDDEIILLGGDDQTVIGLKGEQDSKLTLSLVDTDDADNPSPPRTQEFTLVDTIAPPQPGELGIRVTGEE